jgi:hypothetical protein
VDVVPTPAVEAATSIVLVVEMIKRGLAAPVLLMIPMSLVSTSTTTLGMPSWEN